MCGRYASSRPPDVLAGHFAAEVGDVAGVAPSWNVAPTTVVPVVVARESAPEEGQPAAQPRVVRGMHWGLIPAWASDAGGSGRWINARAETAADKPLFREALRRRRCLVPTDGFYEWRELPGGARQPYFLHSADDQPLAFAGLYDVWRDPARPDAVPLWSCAIVTTAANADVAFLHDRMPVVVEPAAWESWLDPASAAHEIADVLASAACARLASHPVSPAVGDVRRDGPYLVEATNYDEPLALFDVPR